MLEPASEQLLGSKFLLNSAPVLAAPSKELLEPVSAQLIHLKIQLKPSPAVAEVSKVLPERAAGQLVRSIAAQACCSPGRAIKNNRAFGNAG